MNKIYWERKRKGSEGEKQCKRMDKISSRMSRTTQQGIDIDGQGEDYAVGVHHLFPNEKGWFGSRLGHVQETYRAICTHISMIRVVLRLYVYKRMTILPNIAYCEQLTYHSENLISSHF